MKEKLIKFLTRQKEKGSSFTASLEQVSNMEEMEELLNEFEDWDKSNLKVLNKAIIAPQLFNMYSGVNYLSNIYIEKDSFRDKRERIMYSLPKKIQHLNTAIHYVKEAKNTDLLPFEEEDLKAETLEKPKSLNMKKLFISHSSIDNPKIQPLLELITFIGVPHNQIFYSSDPSYGVKPGEYIFDRLKKELINEKLFALFILSSSFYNSPVCLCEMGSVWVKSNRQIPILIPPFDFKDIQGVFPHTLGIKINVKESLNSLKEELESYFELTPVPHSKWEIKRDDYLTIVNALL
jgi:hypothetical protein